MLKPSSKYYLLCLLVLTTFLSKTRASHFYGADLYYTYVADSGAYLVTLSVYGDCSGSSFKNLARNTPRINVFDSFDIYKRDVLLIAEDTNGSEVTPVCVNELNKTACKNPGFDLPGVKRYNYRTYVKLNKPSANWRFVFNGQAFGAGRSNNISNISTMGAIVYLEATLDNTGGPNSSPVYTSIPTPFYFINQQSNYNSGAVDSDKDSLRYALVAGQVPMGYLEYLSPLTPEHPLAVAPGSFTFKPSNGQLSFTPDMQQRALVVYKTSEYRKGKLVGTSIREMTFVVLDNTFLNHPPVADIEKHSGGFFLNGKTISVCDTAASKVVKFEIHPTDADTDNIKIAVAGVPPDAVFNISDNNTPNPHISFEWDVTNVPPGEYNLFITYEDDGCPLVNRETHAYTILVSPVVEKPQLSGKSPICPMDTLRLHAEGNVSTISYLWWGPDGFVSSMPDPVIPDIAYKHAGEYKAVANVYGCFSDTARFMVTVQNPVPPEVSSNSPVNAGEQIRLYATHKDSAAQYYWTGPDSFISKMQNPVIDTATGDEDGVYLVTVNANGCISSRAISIRVLNTDLFVLYPNPNAGNFTIKGNVGDDAASLEVINTLGAVVYRDVMQPSRKWLQHTVTLPPVCVSGFYVAEIKTGGHTIRLPFILVK